MTPFYLALLSPASLLYTLQAYTLCIRRPVLVHTRIRPASLIA